jgi:hypothetical protein
VLRFDLTILTTPNEKTNLFGGKMYPRQSGYMTSGVRYVEPTPACYIYFAMRRNVYFTSG